MKRTSETSSGGIRSSATRTSTAACHRVAGFHRFALAAHTWAPRERRRAQSATGAGNCDCHTRALLDTYLMRAVLVCAALFLAFVVPARSAPNADFPVTPHGAKPGDLHAF